MRSICSMLIDRELRSYVLAAGGSSAGGARWVPRGGRLPAAAAAAAADCVADPVAASLLP